VVNSLALNMWYAPTGWLYAVISAWKFSRFGFLVPGNLYKATYDNKYMSLRSTMRFQMPISTKWVKICMQLNSTEMKGDETVQLKQLLFERFVV
jgi:hypothetical protein